MTEDKIIKMALEAGFTPNQNEWVFKEMLSLFASLVESSVRDQIADEAKHIIKRAEARGTAAEREACAKFIEDGYVRQFEKPWREDLAAAIRARGNE